MASAPLAAEEARNERRERDDVFTGISWRKECEWVVITSYTLSIPRNLSKELPHAPARLAHSGGSGWCSIIASGRASSRGTGAQAAALAHLRCQNYPHRAGKHPPGRG